MQFSEKIPIHANVGIKLWEGGDVITDDHGRQRVVGGRLVYEDFSHNVFTNKGREWIAESNRVRGTTPGPDGTRKIDVFPFYLTVGQGSDQQTISPPGPGSQAESALVTHLEDPAEITSGVYLKAFDRATSEPDQYTNRYEVILQNTDVSFGANPSYPITEFGMVTSDASPTTPGGLKTAAGGPFPGTYDNGFLIAYRAIPPVTKTALFRLQVLWELRF